MQLDIQSLKSAAYGQIDDRIVEFTSRFGARQKEIGRIVRFIMIGASGVVVDFAVLFLLQATVLAPDEPGREGKVLLATAIAFSVAVLNNYYFNRKWTFRESRKRPMRQQATQFVLISLVCGIIRTLFVMSTFAWFGQWLTPAYTSLSAPLSSTIIASSEVSARIGTMASQFVGLLIVTTVNYLGNRHWTFRDTEENASHSH